MQKNPLVSIIIPVYNVEPYLEKCLQSVVTQTYKNIEILLVNDGSTDRSPAVCRAFAARDTRIQVLNQENGGVSSARNAGLEMANGEYVCFIDSDDWVETDYVATLWEVLEKCGADIAVVGFMEERDGGSRSVYRSEGIRVWDMPTAYRKLFRDKKLRNFTWGKLFKRDFFRTVRFPVGRTFEDIAVMGMLVAQAKRVAVSHVPKYHYLIRKGSITQTRSMENEWCGMQALYDQAALGISLGVFKKYPPRFLRRCIRFIDRMIVMDGEEGIPRYMREAMQYVRLYEGRSLGEIGLKGWGCKWLILKYPDFYCRWIRRIKG